MPIDVSGGIDKEALYGFYLEGARADKKLAVRAAHMALDIPMDDMIIHADKTTNNYYQAPPPDMPAASQAESAPGRERSMAAAVSKTPVAQPVAKSSALAMAMKVALGTGLVATGIGVPFGAGMIANTLLNRPDPPAAVSPSLGTASGTDTTTDTTTDVKARATIERSGS